jgi:FtsZ-interacting cell division protein ZipA
MDRTETIIVVAVIVICLLFMGWIGRKYLK